MQLEIMGVIRLNIVLGIVMASTALAAPADDAVKAYRDYVAAIRAGSKDNVLKVVESVPESSKPLLVASIESLIAVEAVKAEMTKQMGPEPAEEEEGWNMGQLPERVLKDLKGEATPDGTVKLKAHDPLAKSDYEIGVMVRRGDRWVVPAMTVIGLETTAQFEEPPQSEREDLLKQARAVTAAGKSVLGRLQKKEFKTPVEVQEALTRETVTGLGAAATQPAAE